MRCHQANLAIRNFFRQCFFHRLQALFAKLLDCRSNLGVALRAEPLGAEIRFTFFDQLGDHINHRAELTAANLCYLLERPSFFEKLQSIFSRVRRGGVPIIAGAFALMESLQGFQDFPAIALHLLVSEARDRSQCLQGSRLSGTQRIQRSVMQHDERGYPQISCCIAPPLAQIFPQLGIGDR